MALCLRARHVQGRGRLYSRLGTQVNGFGGAFLS
jgi:hypothetical protein